MNRFPEYAPGPNFEVQVEVDRDQWISRGFFAEFPRLEADLYSEAGISARIIDNHTQVTLYRAVNGGQA